MADTATPESTGAAETPMDGGKRRSRWMAHVKKTMRAHKGKSLNEVLKMAKKTYKKTRRGGGGDEEEAPMTAGGTLAPLPLGGRRRGSRKGSKKSKKGSRKH